MSFTQSAKIEIIDQTIDKNVFKSFLSGLIISSGTITNENIRITLNNLDIFNQITSLIEQNGINFKTISSNKIIISSSDVDVEIPKKDIRYFVIGMFIGGGSVTSPESTSYHLEMKIKIKKFTDEILQIMNSDGFNFNVISRKLTDVIYLKKADLISDFLKAIGASNSVMFFEDIRIQRDFRNNLNRLGNFDVYNQKKVASSSAMHMDLIEFIKENDLEGKFREEELIFMKERYENPELSLSELSTLLYEKHGIKKSKSALGHWIRKLREIFDRY